MEREGSLAHHSDSFILSNTPDELACLSSWYATSFAMDTGQPCQELREVWLYHLVPVLKEHMPTLWLELAVNGL